MTIPNMIAIELLRCRR